MEEAYAQALLQIVESGTEPKKAVHALFESLKSRGREALMPRIGRAFERLAEREIRKSAVVVAVADERDAHAARKAAAPLLDEIGAHAKDVTLRVDKDLIGGWRLEGRGMLADHSFKKQLLEMYNRAAR